MPQFLIDATAIKEDIATISGDDANHIINVLRLKKDDWLMLTDGEGHRWKAEIVSTMRKEVKAKLTHALTHPSTSLRAGLRTYARLILAQALIKHDRFEWIIQKAVELGCSKIIPFTSERTIAKGNKLPRWQKIADTAAKQCGTAIRPVVSAPLPFAELLKQLKQYEQAIMFYEGETSTNLNTSTLKHLSTLLIIGPEGGFSSGEVEATKKAGIVTCGLGPLILRVETAALAALTLMQYKLGYFDQHPINL